MSTTSNNLETTSEEFKEFGSKLKAIRESKGLSIDDAHNAIRINKRVLIAFEDNRFDESIDEYNNSVYLRAYLSKYCTYLGLQAYAFEAYGIYPKTTSKVLEVNKIGAGSAKSATRQNIYSSKGSSKLKTIAFLLLTLLIIASLCYVLLRSTGVFNKVEVQPQTRVETLQENSKPVETTTYSPSKVISNNKTNENKDKVYTVKPDTEETNNVSDSNKSLDNKTVVNDENKEETVNNQDGQEKLDNNLDKEDSLAIPGIPAKGLYFKGKGDCWITIKSTANNNKTRGLLLKANKDKLIDTDGVFLIGAPKAVDVYFNGKIVNMSLDKGRVYLYINNGKLNVVYK